MRSLLILVFLAACSSAPMKPSEKVSTYIQERKEDFEFKDKGYENLYGEYLAGVEKFYEDNFIPFKFDNYLNGLRNQTQLLSHLNYTLDGRFRKETGLNANRNPREFVTYKARTIAWQGKKLDEQRIQKLQTDLGSELFSKLKEHHREFHQRKRIYSALPL